MLNVEKGYDARRLVAKSR